MAYNLLLIDDSSIVRKVLRKTLRAADVPVNEVHEAANGEEALELMQDNWIDLAFLDINMPVMNGMEFMEAVYQNEALRNTPVIVVSTEGSKERRERLEELGVKAYLRKPVTPESVAKAINGVLGGPTE